MKVNGIMAEPPTLSHLSEFDAPYLNGLETLADDHVGAVKVVAVFLWKILASHVAGRHDLDATRQQRYRGARLGTAISQLGIDAVPDTGRQPVLPLLVDDVLRTTRLVVDILRTAITHAVVRPQHACLSFRVVDRIEIDPQPFGAAFGAAFHFQLFRVPR